MLGHSLGAIGDLFQSGGVRSDFGFLCQALQLVAVALPRFLEGLVESGLKSGLKLCQREIGREERERLLYDVHGALKVARSLQLTC